MEKENIVKNDFFKTYREVRYGIWRRADTGLWEGEIKFPDGTYFFFYYREFVDNLDEKIRKRIDDYFDFGIDFNLNDNIQHNLNDLQKRRDEF